MNRKNETAAYQPKTWGLLPNISSTLKQSLQQLEYAREDIMMLMPISTQKRNQHRNINVNHQNVSIEITLGAK